MVWSDARSIHCASGEPGRMLSLWARNRRGEITDEEFERAKAKTLA